MDPEEASEADCPDLVLPIHLDSRQPWQKVAFQGLGGAYSQGRKVLKRT
jgi:hypothetical protein